MSSAEGTGPERKVYKDHNLHVLWGVTLMAVLGVSSVTPAFPAISREFGISGGQVGLLITVFTLPGIVLTPVLGVLSDRYGRKKILVPALLLFGVAGGACVFARDFQLLLVLRAFQGMGAAALGTLNVTVIGDIYGGRERSAALGYNSSVLSVGTASYPAVGGVLATFGWFYPFALPVIAVPIAVVVLFSLRNPEPLNEQGLKEYFGSVWGHLRDREVLGLIGASLMTFIILFGPQLSYLPILMNDRFDAPSYVIGAVLSGASLTTALVSSQLGRLTGRFDEKTLLKTSFSLYAIALAAVATAPTLSLLLVPAVLFGVAQGINLPNVFSLLNSHAPNENRGAFMATNGMSLRTGQTIGPLLMASLAGTLGVTNAYLASAAIALAAFLLVLAFVR
ncbi:MFS transporter [Rubrobacter tropicus]|uniref:MFS transporter n=1 Tax=Rubrobacter tropicus TaxID=2653851 RepID=A0A6G8Q8C3_9ACTN|nr:MFS transporter [Rubrobacter tropicus]QIN82735.1 MFS transporter [Rubrobacter tropicus]